MTLGQEHANASQARFLDADGRRVAVWFNAIGQLRYVVCDTLTANCTGSRNYDELAQPQEASAMFVTNPSQP